MGEPQIIVTENYPADKLPEELRAGLEAGSVVRVTVEPVFAHSSPRPLSHYFGTAGRVHDDPVADIRKLRDEWE